MRLVKPRDILRIKWGWELDTSKLEDRYFARCADCDWNCHATPHRDIAVAERCMIRHVVSKHPPERNA